MDIIQHHKGVVCSRDTPKKKHYLMKTQLDQSRTLRTDFHVDFFFAKLSRKIAGKSIEMASFDVNHYILLAHIFPLTLNWGERQERRRTRGIHKIQLHSRKKNCSHKLR